MIEKKTYTVVKKISKLRLTLAGGTLSKSLVLKSIPVLPYEAVNMLYCESVVTGHLTNMTHLNPRYRELLHYLNSIKDKISYLEGITGNLQQQINGLLNKSGGVMTGTLKLAYTPTQAKSLINKKYVDDKVSNAQYYKTGDLLLKPSNTVDPLWLKCDGSIYNISSYQDLYNVLGGGYSNGETIPVGKFKVPDTRKTDINIPNFATFIKI